MGERARERRQKATYNNLSHPSQFLVHFFFCRHCTITTYFFLFPKSVPGEFDYISDKLIVLIMAIKLKLKRTRKHFLRFERFRCTVHFRLRKRNILITRKE